jgi:dihydrofolate reductase
VIRGATLATEAAASGLIDEYWVHPVVVGGGIPFFPQVLPSLPVCRVSHSAVPYAPYTLQATMAVINATPGPARGSTPS